MHLRIEKDTVDKIDRVIELWKEKFKKDGIAVVKRTTAAKILLNNALDERLKGRK